VSRILSAHHHGLDALIFDVQTELYKVNSRVAYRVAFLLIRDLAALLRDARSALSEVFPKGVGAWRAGGESVCPRGLLELQSSTG